MAAVSQDGSSALSDYLVLERQAPGMPRGFSFTKEARAKQARSGSIAPYVPDLRPGARNKVSSAMRSTLGPWNKTPSAAARFCERSEGMNWSNLLRCGATLEAHSFRIKNTCREVLRRYGQL